LGKEGAVAVLEVVDDLARVVAGHPSDELGDGHGVVLVDVDEPVAVDGVDAEVDHAAPVLRVVLAAGHDRGAGGLRVADESRLRRGHGSS